MVSTLHPLSDVAPEQLLYRTDEPIFGKSYEQWTHNWWGWFVSIPYDRHPAKDSDGRFANINANAEVIYLAGAVDHSAKRIVTIPHDKAVLVPILVIENSEKEWPGSGVDDLEKLSRGFADDMISLTAVFDEGKESQAVFRTGFLASTRVDTREFNLDFAPNNIFLREGGQGIKASQSGYWLFFREGVFKKRETDYTLRFHGEGEYYETEVSYTLRIG